MQFTDSVKIRLTPELGERIDSARRPLGMDRSNFIRSVLAEKLEPKAHPKAEKAA